MKTLASVAFGAIALATASIGFAEPAAARGDVGIYVGPFGFGVGVDRYEGYCRDGWYRRNHWDNCGRYYDGGYYDNDYGYDNGYYRNGYYNGGHRRHGDDRGFRNRDHRGRDDRGGRNGHHEHGDRGDHRRGW